MITVEEDFIRTPEKMDVIWTIKNTAKVMPTSRAAYLPLSFTRSLKAIRRIPFIAVFEIYAALV